MRNGNNFWHPIFDAVARNIFGFAILIIFAGAVFLIGATLFIIWPLLAGGGIGIVAYKVAKAKGVFDKPKPVEPLRSDTQWEARHASLEIMRFSEKLAFTNHIPEERVADIFRPFVAILMSTDKKHIGTTTEEIQNVAEYLIDPIRFPRTPSPFLAPFYDMGKRPAKDVIHTAAISFHNKPGFEALTSILDKNICAQSGIPLHARYDMADKYVWPTESKLFGEKLVEAYLKNTPLHELMIAPIPFEIPDKQLMEHTFMCAPSGHGKSQAIQTFILYQLHRDDSPGMFIIDSHGDMLPKLEKLALFNAKIKDRLVVIDPEDPLPPALNFMDFKGNEASSAELFAYLMSALSSDLTSKQSTVVAFILRLMAVIPDATIDTLREVMEDPAKTVAQSKFIAYINALDPISQSFFATQFYNNQMNVTKQAVARRIYSLLANRTFATMFGASKNKFSAFDAMQQKKIVIINTSQKLLRSDNAVFGRFMIAQILSAAYERVNVPERERHPCLVTVDEASQYLDEQIESILTETRKYKVGIFLATQYVEQIPAGVKAAVYGNTSTKIIGPVAHSDATALAREMYTSTEFIRSMSKSDAFTHFAIYSRGLTPQAIQISLGLGIVERQPIMTAEEHAAIRQANREKFGISPARTVVTTAGPPPRVMPPPLPKTVRDPSVAAEY